MMNFAGLPGARALSAGGLRKNASSNLPQLLISGAVSERLRLCSQESWQASENDEFCIKKRGIYIKSDDFAGEPRPRRGAAGAARGQRTI